VRNLVIGFRNSIAKHLSARERFQHVLLSENGQIFVHLEQVGLDELWGADNEKSVKFDIFYFGAHSSVG
jgi:hypothetical protein